MVCFGSDYILRLVIGCYNKRGEVVLLANREAVLQSSSRRRRSKQMEKADDHRQTGFFEKPNILVLRN
jgi:hypothetical protein